MTDTTYFWTVLTCTGLAIILVISAYLPRFWGAPWVPTPLMTIHKMLRVAGVQPGERVVDLGAGDGRAVILAALLHKAQAVGVEIDPLRCGLANLLILLLGQRRRARVQCGNLFDFDLRGADLVILYLQQDTNQQIKARLLDQLQPGARVVSYTFSLSGWAPAIIDERRGFFVYHIGDTGPDVRTQFV